MTAQQLMLDTNTVSHIVKGHPQVMMRLGQTAMADVCISVITEAELLFGLARRPDATRLHRVIDEFRRRVDVLPWDSSVAPVYGDLRASLASNGTLIGALDLLIAAHALAADRILVTSDRDFARIARLNTQDWTG